MRCTTNEESSPTSNTVIILLASKPAYRQSKGRFVATEFMLFECCECGGWWLTHGAVIRVMAMGEKVPPDAARIFWNRHPKYIAGFFPIFNHAFFYPMTRSSSTSRSSCATDQNRLGAISRPQIRRWDRRRCRMPNFWVTGRVSSFPNPCQCTLMNENRRIRIGF
jgi:hypothetical protein